MTSPPPLAATDPLRIVVLGALNQPKGLGVVADLARAVRRRRGLVTITVIGPTADPAALRRLGVRVHGAYTETELPGLLAAANPHVVLFAAIWPETWSFTLSEALRTAADIVAFDIGAIAARLKRLGRGRILPYPLHDDPEGLLDAMLDLRQEFVQVMPSQPRAGTHR